MNLLNSREDENERQGARALGRYGPGGLSGRLNDQTYSLKSGIFSLPFSDEPMGTQFNNGYKDGGQVRGAMQKMPMNGGAIDGPGTGKSDSIKTNLPVSGFVLPVEVVAAIGIDKLNAMIALFDQESRAEDQAEGREEVPAKVSDGEFLVPPEVVQATGPEYWDGLIAKVTGQSAQPEMGEHGEMMAAGGGLIDARNQAAEFWKTAPQNPVPIPGRANPANPADMMAARLKTSANAQAQQAPSLRSQMINQGALPPQAPVQAPVTLSTPAAPAYQTPDPHKNFLKNANNMMAGEGAIATGLAYDILNAPQNSGQVNGAIAGLKQRAGFDHNSTPYPSLKNVAMPVYKNGGAVKGYAGGGYIDYRKLIEDTTGVTPGEKLGKGKPSVPSSKLPGELALVPVENTLTRTANVEPVVTTQGYKPPVDLASTNKQMITNSPEVIANRANYNAGQQSANLRAKGFGEGLKASSVQNLQVNPNAGLNERGIPIDRPQSPFNSGTVKGGLKNLLNNMGGQGALATGLAYDIINSPKNIEQVNNAISGLKTRSGLPQEGQPYPSLRQVASTIKSDISQTPVVNQPGTAQRSVIPGQIPPPMLASDPSQANANFAATQRNAAQVQPPQGAMPTIGKVADWNETGFRTDSAPQTLAWNESRWSNSGDTVKDAALNARQEALIGLRQQANIMNQNPEIAGALNPATAYIPQEQATENIKIDTLNAIDRDKMAQASRELDAARNTTKYQAVRNPDDNTVQQVPESGPGADAAYQSSQMESLLKDIGPAMKALDPGSDATPEERAYASYIYQKYQQLLNSKTKK